MESKRFSIIIPVYKVEKYLSECVYSVLAQTFTNYELLLIDDGSPDNCPQICDKLAEEDSRIKVIHKPNGGLSDARNTGLKTASGEYILFLDSDDFYLNNVFLEKIDKELQKTLSDIVFFQRRIYSEQNNILQNEPAPYDSKTLSITDSSILLYELSKKDQLDASAAMKAIKRSYLFKENLYFYCGLLSEDIEWFFRLMRISGKVCLLNSPSYCYRVHTGSISHNISKKNIDDLFFAIRSHADYFRNDTHDFYRKIAMLNYMSYQYFIVLGLAAHYLKRNEKKAVLEECRKYKWLCTYSISPKTKKAAFLVRVLGIRLASIILGRYIGSK